MAGGWIQRTTCKGHNVALMYILHYRRCRPTRWRRARVSGCGSSRAGRFPPLTSILRRRSPRLCGVASAGRDRRDIAVPLAHAGAGRGYRGGAGGRTACPGLKLANAPHAHSGLPSRGRLRPPHKKKPLDGASMAGCFVICACRVPSLLFWRGAEHTLPFPRPAAQPWTALSYLESAFPQRQGRRGGLLMGAWRGGRTGGRVPHVDLGIVALELLRP